MHKLRSGFLGIGSPEIVQVASGPGFLNLTTFLWCREGGLLQYSGLDPLEQLGEEILELREEEER